MGTAGAKIHKHIKSNNHKHHKGSASGEHDGNTNALLEQLFEVERSKNSSRFKGFFRIPGL